MDNPFRELRAKEMVENAIDDALDWRIAEAQLRSMMEDLVALNERGRNLALEMELLIAAEEEERERERGRGR
jgi:hypothetical protein